MVSSVQTGQAIQGQVLFTNTGPARAARLELSASHAYATMTSPVGTIRIPPGSPPGTPFTVTVAKNSPIGSALLIVKVVSAADPRTVYSAGTLVVTVTRPPSMLVSTWDRYHWFILGAVILLLLLLLLAIRRRRARKDAADVRGLYTSIRRNGEQVGAELKAPNKRADTFRFVIRDESEPTARLDYPRPEDTAYAGPARPDRPGQGQDADGGGLRHHRRRIGRAVAERPATGLPRCEIYGPDIPHQHQRGPFQRPEGRRRPSAWRRRPPIRAAEDPPPPDPWLN